MKKFKNIAITLFMTTAALLMFAACEEVDESVLIYSKSEIKRIYDTGNSGKNEKSDKYSQLIMYFLKTEYMDGSIEESYTFEITDTNGSVIATGTIAGTSKGGKGGILNDKGFLQNDSDVYLKFDDSTHPVDLTNNDNTDKEGKLVVGKTGDEEWQNGTLKCHVQDWSDTLLTYSDYGQFFDFSGLHGG